MIRKVYSKRFILFFISLLASNENLSSVKYSVCVEEGPTTGELKTRCLFTKDFHNNIASHRDYHECDSGGLQVDYKVYDNEFYNFICSVRTDNYRAYIFFRILENILSECSGVYCRKKVNRYFGIFYGSVIGFFFNNSRRYFKKKHFTIEFFNGLRLNLVSALIYITKAMLVENYYTHDLHGIRKFLKHTRYAIACIHGINGFHIIHVNFSKIITLSFFNILKIISVILKKLQYSFVLVTGLFSNIEEWLDFFRLDTYVQKIKLNPSEQFANTSYVELYNYNVFNGFIHIRKEDEGFPYNVKLISSRYSNDNGDEIHNDIRRAEWDGNIDYYNFEEYEQRCNQGNYYDEGCDIYNVVKKVKSIRRRNCITNILNYIWFALAPSISFDLTKLLSDK